MNTESNHLPEAVDARPATSDFVRRPGRFTGRCVANYGRTARSTWRRSIAAGVVLFGFGMTAFRLPQLRPTPWPWNPRASAPPSRCLTTSRR